MQPCVCVWDTHSLSHTHTVCVLQSCKPTVRLYSWESGHNKAVLSPNQIITEVLFHPISTSAVLSPNQIITEVLFHPISTSAVLSPNQIITEGLFHPIRSLQRCSFTQSARRSSTLPPNHTSSEAHSWKRVYHPFMEACVCVEGGVCVFS